MNTEYICFNCMGVGDVSLLGEKLIQTEKLNTLTPTSLIKEDLKRKLDWLNSKKTPGALGDRKIGKKVKGKIVSLDGSEICPVKKGTKKGWKWRRRRC